MAIFVKNISTNAVQKIGGLSKGEGRKVSFYENKVPGARFITSHADVLTPTYEGGKLTGFTLNQGYEFANGAKKEGAAPKKAAPKKSSAAPKEEPKAEAPKAKKAATASTQSTYDEFKQKYPDSVLLWRIGDFYETYGDDASLCAAVLGITLTRDKKKGRYIAGFPHHALDTYLPKLIRAGKRVAICEGDKVQTAEPAKKEEKKTEKEAPKCEAQKAEAKAETEAYAEEAKMGVDAEVIRKELVGKYGSMGEDMFASVMKLAGYAKPNAKQPVDKAEVLECVNERMNEIVEKWKDNGRASKVVEVKILGSEERNKVDKPHPLFEKVLPLVVNDRAIGRFPWLYGPAGSGKSTLAAQIAQSLGLPFYSVSSLQQKYELEGYTDAVGKLVETTFYKAAKEGGIFLFDEASTTSAEVNVAFNSMLANLRYNFPKEGMVDAHKDFHIIAADNTAGWGGDKRYHARYEMDASTLDRYIPIAIDYQPELDLDMANGDADLVKFINDVRSILLSADLKYTASPRVSKCIKVLQAIGIYDDKEIMKMGLCGAWSQQDIRTIAARLTGSTKYHKTFKSLV